MKHLSNSNNSTSNHDELKARFTAWISVVVWRARRDYFRSQQWHLREIPFEETDEIQDDNSFEALEKDEFIFADERLEKAFLKLSPCQQQVITLRIAKGLLNPGTDCYRTQLPFLRILASEVANFMY